MSQYKNDPRWVRATHDGFDSKGAQFKRGDEVFFFPSTRTILSGDAAETASRSFDASAQDEMQFNSAW